MSNTETGKRGGGLRTALAITGTVAAIIGLLILIWPGHTAIVVTAIIAAYAIVSGIVYASFGIFGRSRGGWSRFGYLVLGVIFIAAGVIAFTQLSATTAWLFTFVGVVVGILWIVEGIITLTAIGASSAKVISVIFAVLSILFGVFLVLSPLYSIVLWIWLGAALLILGIIQIIRAITWKGRVTAL